MSEKTKPAHFAIAIILSDSTNIDFGQKGSITRGIYVGSGGDISVEMAGEKNRGDGMSDPTVIFKSVLSGTLLPIGVTRVNNTATTASSLVAVW